MIGVISLEFFLCAGLTDTSILAAVCSAVVLCGVGAAYMSQSSQAIEGADAPASRR
jgi:hypothetical protein